MTTSQRSKAAALLGSLGGKARSRSLTALFKVEQAMIQTLTDLTR